MPGKTGFVMRAVLILLLVGLAVGFLLLRTARAADGGDTVAVLQLTVNGVDKGAVRVVVDQRYALAQAATAHADLAARRTTGSCVLIP